MKLSDNEIRDITKLLEEGRTLPDKYRFILFGDDRELELVWNGKTSDVTNVILPFQTIEHIDEPRPEEAICRQQFDMFDKSGRQLKGWANKLIWGDNKFILSSLKNGPLREEIEEQGGIKLIYIDPPFDVGADFKVKIGIGDETLSKEANVLEEIAYRDTWGKGADSYLTMICERLFLMRELLESNGILCVHIGPQVSHFVKIILDQLFGSEKLLNEIVWQRRLGQSNTDRNKMGVVTESIFVYAKSENYTYNPQFSKEEAEKYIKERYTKRDNQGRQYKTDNLGNPAYRPNLIYEYKGHKPPPNGWAVSLERMKKMDQEGRLEFPAKTGGRLMRRQFLDEWKGKPIQSLWHDIPPINSQAEERLGYDTQKPEKLLNRIIQMFSSPTDLVADFFCGSGSTLAAAEKLERKWIGSDLGKFAIHTTRKRLINVQRKLKTEGKDYRAFEVLNLGRYERQYFVSGMPEIDKKVQTQKDTNREIAFNNLILQAYEGESISGFRTFRGKKKDRIIAIGPANLPVSRLFVEAVIQECVEKGITKVDLLSFEFEMGLFPNMQDNAASKGVDLVIKHIPKEVFDKRAVDKGEAKFHDVAYIEVVPSIKGNTVGISLTNYSVFYTQGSAVDTEKNLKNGRAAIVVDNGQVIKLSKDKNGMNNPREVLTKNWHDWIDYWSIDFDFESKKEIIQIKDAKAGETKDVWTGDYIFENEWQSFRTRQDRSLELQSAYWECSPGRRRIAIKVIDIFGNDTMKIIPVTIGGKV
jgi:adenine-specific DNA-methyltransferase